MGAQIHYEGTVEQGRGLGMSRHRRMEALLRRGLGGHFQGFKGRKERRICFCFVRVGKGARGEPVLGSKRSGANERLKLAGERGRENQLASRGCCEEIKGGGRTEMGGIARRRHLKMTRGEGEIGETSCKVASEEKKNPGMEE